MASVVVVGGSLAGLAVAARLARQRHEVTLLDAGAPGERGLNGAHEPASFTLPAVYRDLFRKTGRPLEPDVRLVPVDPARRYLFPDGRVLDLPTANRAAMLDAFGRGLGSTAAREWDAFITWGGALWAELRPRLVPDGEATGPHEALPARPRLRDPCNRLLLDWYVSDAGADMARAPNDVAVLPYLEQAFGAWQVVGGLAALSAATAQRARRCGATLLGGRLVVEVLLRDGAAVGVRVADGTSVEAEVVIDAAGLTAPPGRADRARNAGPASVTVRLQCVEPPDLPVEIVLLPRDGEGGAIVVARPDVTAQPLTVLVRGTVPTVPAAGSEAEIAGRFLATLGHAGVALSGQAVGMSVQPSRETTRGRRWRRRVAPDWLDLRSGLTERGTDGLFRVAPQVGGGLAVPWQGLAAALAASACGTVPRHR